MGPNNPVPPNDHIECSAWKTFSPAPPFTSCVRPLHGPVKCWRARVVKRGRDVLLCDADAAPVAPWNCSSSGKGGGKGGLETTGKRGGRLNIRGGLQCIFTEESETPQGTNLSTPHPNNTTDGSLSNIVRPLRGNADTGADQAARGLAWGYTCTIPYPLYSHTRPPFYAPANAYDAVPCTAAGSSRFCEGGARVPSPQAHLHSRQHPSCSSYIQPSPLLCEQSHSIACSGARRGTAECPSAPQSATLVPIIAVAGSGTLRN